METKQVIVIRKDLRMRRGKEIAQGAHASTAWLSRKLQRGCFCSCDRCGPMDEHDCGRQACPGQDLFLVSLTKAQREWLESSFRKITLQVDSLDELISVYEAAKAAGLEAHLVTDKGDTEFHGTPTQTAVAIGPDYAENIDPITKDLRLY